MTNQISSPEICSSRDRSIESLKTPANTAGVFFEGQFLPGHSPIRKNLHEVKTPEVICMSLFTDSQGRQRDDRLMRINIDGYGHGIRETLSAYNDDALTLVHFPGFTEKIENGSAKLMHDNLVNNLPHARIISVATDGVGTTTERLTCKNALDHGITEMAERRRQLVYALVGDAPVIVSGTSMGSVIGWKMLDFDAREGHLLNAYPVGYASANVSPELTLPLMGVLFPISMAADMPREIIRLALRRPDNLSELITQVQDRKPDAIPLIVQAASLLGGTATKVLHRVNDVYGGGATISGVFDPLSQFARWKQVKGKGTELHIIPVARRGHGMAADGTGGGQKIANVIIRNEIDKKLLTA